MFPGAAKLLVPTWPRTVPRASISCWLLFPLRCRWRLTSRRSATAGSWWSRWRRAAVSHICVLLCLLPRCCCLCLCVAHVGHLHRSPVLGLPASSLVTGFWCPVVLASTMTADSCCRACITCPLQQHTTSWRAMAPALMPSALSTCCAAARARRVPSWCAPAPPGAQASPLAPAQPERAVGCAPPLFPVYHSLGLLLAALPTRRSRRASCFTCSRC